MHGALGVGERIELVNQAFGVDPAQAMRADIELAGVVADDHAVAEQAMRLDAAPRSAFGGDQDGIGMNLQRDVVRRTSRRTSRMKSRLRTVAGAYLR